MRNLNFPDLPHFRQLQRDIWRWPVSKAAVMVGAGVSMNADSLPGFDKEFPTWRGLVRVMFDELYPAQNPGDSEEEARLTLRFNQMDALRLASEYEAAFDRGRLERLIKKENPDEHFQPGLLHSLLLELPWRDVFTTNYDTLLERTEVSDRLYQSVFTAKDLTDTFSPRIIKLHGSFPSHPPFVITEDDYRTYPQKRAPFVNTVQQSLIENSLVMLGFSGDDPNFLSWVGWIRDELGDAHSPIYLVGPLRLEASRRSLLKQRGVTPVDLAPIFESQVTSQTNLHRLSLEWFLKSLQKGRPENPENWLSNLSRWKDGDSVGGVPIMGDPKPSSVQAGLSPKSNRLEESEFLKLMSAWVAQRKNYPGWLVLEHGKRAEVWNATRMWVDPLIIHCEEKESLTRLLVANEITWRLKISMSPNLVDWHPFFQDSLEKALPCLMDRSLDTTEAFPETFAETGLLEAWVNVARSLLRDYREDFHLDKWTDLLELFNKLTESGVASRAEIEHEQVLHALWNLDFRRADRLLGAWKVEESDPHNLMRKAGAYAELDKLDESERLLDQALKAIRRSIVLEDRGVEMLSLEGWCLALIFGVRCSKNPEERGRILAEYRERWKALRAYDCDPWLHIEFFSQVLTPDPPKVKVGATKSYGFDPGRVSHRQTWRSDLVGPILPAFAYLRLLEQTGMPFKLAGQDVVGEKLANALWWVSSCSDFWSPCILVRAGRLKDFDEKQHLSRVQVASLGEKQALKIADWALQVAERDLSHFGRQADLLPHQELVLRGLPEIISRLSMWLDKGRLNKSFKLAMAFGESPAIRLDRILSKLFSNWIERILDSAANETPSDWLIKALKFPVFEKGKAIQLGTREESYDVIHHFDYEVAKNETDPHIFRQMETEAELLIRFSESEVEQTRREAIARLRWLFYSEKLSTSLQEKLGDLLWRGVKASSPEIPGNTIVNLLHLPTATGVNRSEEVKKLLIKDAPVTSVNLNSETGIASSSNMMETYDYHKNLSFATAPHFEHDYHFPGTVEWSQKEVNMLAAQLFKWWDHEKKVCKQLNSENAKPLESSLPHNIGKAALHMALFLMRAVRWKQKGHAALRKKVASFSDELFECGLHPFKLKLYEVVSGDLDSKLMADFLAEALGSENNGEVKSAADATLHWVLLQKARILRLPHPVVVNRLVERVAFRQREGLETAIRCLRCIVETGEDILAKSDLIMLVGSIDSWLKATEIQRGCETEFEVNERPKLLEDYCCLVCSLQTLPVSMINSEVKKKISSVRTFALNHSLPEVRRSFAD